MPLKCPKCHSGVIKKNGTIHNGKQKYECLSCHRQFVEHPENKVVSDDTKERIRRALLERVSLEGLCRILTLVCLGFCSSWKRYMKNFLMILMQQFILIMKNLRSSQRKLMRCGVMLETSKISSGFGW